MRFWFSFGCFLVFAQVLSAGSDQPLPKIRVARHGLGFVTENGKPFVPFGVTYYRPGTGWAPQVWKDFNADATRADFGRMKDLGVNCVRVFLSFGSFYHEPGKLDANGLVKFDQFLAIAGQNGIYVHVTGPDYWEGPPMWKSGGIGDEESLALLETFWKKFAARYKGRNVIFSYDLGNEPAVGWDKLTVPWNEWLQKKYRSVDKINAVWNAQDMVFQFGAIAIPKKKNSLNDPKLLDFQAFREHLADEWTRRQAEAIKSADRKALVTVGMVQWSVPMVLPGDVSTYSGFRPQQQARYLDYLTIHFYPLADGGYKYLDHASELRNLAYLEGLVKETRQSGKPLVLGEFGWYGGTNKPTFNGGAFPPATEAQQAEYDQDAVKTSEGIACGWMNWGFYDQPEANDCSQQTGLVAADGKVKDWGLAFQELASQIEGQTIRPKKLDDRPALDWNACLSNTAAEKEFFDRYYAAFLESH